MVQYEWDVETVEVDSGDIVDHTFTQNFKEAKHAASGQPEEGFRYDIVLVRDDDKGREWAYLKDGKLPEYFRDAHDNEGSRVPQRFHKEVAAK